MSLSEAFISSDKPSSELLALDDALNKLAEFDLQKSNIVEMRYFGGLTIEEIAEVLGISSASVRRHWSMAKAWLRREVGAQT